MGSQPSAPFWSPDGNSLFFKWNPNRSERDSLFEFNLHRSSVHSFKGDADLQFSTRTGSWNKYRTKCVFACRGDLYLKEVSSGKLIRITQTQVEETQPEFCFSDQRILYRIANDLFTWSMDDGSVQQICHFKGSDEKYGGPISLTLQDSLLQHQELSLFSVLQSRRKKTRLMENKYRNPDSVRVFESGGKLVQNVGLGYVHQGGNSNLALKAY